MAHRTLSVVPWLGFHGEWSGRGRLYSRDSRGRGAAWWRFREQKM